MRFLIVLEPTETGFGVQVPDLAIVTHGESLDEARRAALTAIQVNLETYREVDQEVPERQPVLEHLENPDFRDLFFTHVEVAEPKGRVAA